jgi:hypothetical protein
MMGHVPKRQPQRLKSSITSGRRGSSARPNVAKVTARQRASESFTTARCISWISRAGAVLRLVRSTVRRERVEVVSFGGLFRSLGGASNLSRRTAFHSAHALRMMCTPRMIRTDAERLHGVVVENPLRDAVHNAGYASSPLIAQQIGDPAVKLTGVHHATFRALVLRPPARSSGGSSYGPRR